MPFQKLLIANRGEIAVRIVRACRELGIRSVVAHSTADADSLAVQMADEAICIGPPPPARSYLNIPALASALEVTGADALHPGYGFLAENAYLAEVCREMGVTFIGPDAEVITLCGDKVEARRRMKAAGVPVVPGSDGPVATLEEARGIAAELGYPVLLKAVAGGGGRGMRVAYTEADLVRAFPLARSEAEKAFGNGELYVEKFISPVRHVEVQVLADRDGRVIHLGERDCSVQRRHQKLIEEAPSPAVDEDLRKRMGEAAVRGAQALGYTTAGTFEFILDEAGNFYFIEVNARIQVEHPVTEQVTGLDLVKAQILTAAGEPLPLRQEDVQIRGHAIECRINAEDPERNFLPSAGTIQRFLPPGGPGVRVDAHLFPGYTVPAYYDSLLAKVIAWGKDREEALVRMERALEEMVLEGVATNQAFHLRVLRHPRFRAGQVDTGFVRELRAEEG